MKTPPFSLEQLVTRIEVPIDLHRDKFMLLREGGRDLQAWKKSMIKMRSEAKKLPIDPAFDSVKEVRAYRTGEAG